jgi:hypothetical protein
VASLYSQDDCEEHLKVVKGRQGSAPAQSALDLGYLAGGRCTPAAATATDKQGPASFGMSGFLRGETDGTPKYQLCGKPSLGHRDALKSEPRDAPVSFDLTPGTVAAYGASGSPTRR